MRARAALAALLLAGCSDSLPAVPTPATTTIAISGGSGLPSELTLSSADQCYLSPVSPTTGRAELDLIAGTGSGSRLFMALRGFDARVGGSYTDLTGPASATGTVIELSPRPGVAWVGDQGSVTLEALDPPHASGAINVTLRPFTTGASGSVQLSGRWQCTMALTAAPTAPATR